MRWRRHYRRKRRGAKRGRGIPYIYNNRIYFGKRPQKDTKAISRVIARLLEIVGDVIGLNDQKEI